MRRQTAAFRLFPIVAAMVLAQLMPLRTQAQGPSAPTGANALSVSERQAGDLPERVGRIARLNGNVSFHTLNATDWTQAAVNYPVATGEAFWTEANASGLLEIATSRVALAGGTELDIAPQSRWDAGNAARG